LMILILNSTEYSMTRSELSILGMFYLPFG
jgi:hypothetical protein